MHANSRDFPPAPPDRIADAEKLFPFKTMTPEEYFNREADKWVCFSFDEYQYPDPQLNVWIHKLGELFANEVAQYLQRRSE